VRYLLEGSVRTSTDRVRIEARLVEATSGAEFWANHFEGSLKEIFAVQDRIVETIVTTLNLQMSLLERGALARARQTTDNPEAYDDVLQGLVYSWKETKEDDDKALKWFEKAVELDPNYVDAYGLMSATIFNDWDWQWTQDPNALKRSFEFVQKALELDDARPTAHIILSRLLLEQHHFDAAAAETRRGDLARPQRHGKLLLFGERKIRIGRPTR
jgi:adenylate cyclase